MQYIHIIQNIHKLLTLFILLTFSVGISLAVTPTVVFAKTQGCNSPNEVHYLTEDESAFLVQLNNYRTDHKLNSLKTSRVLTCVARYMSQDLIDNHRLSHVDSSGRDFDKRLSDFGYGYNTYIGENLAAGISGSGEVFEQWRQSPHHEVNMLHKKFKVTGVARIDGGDLNYYWSNEFGGKEIPGDEIGSVLQPDISAPTVTINLHDQTIKRYKKLSIPIVAHDEYGGSGLASIEIFQNDSLVKKMTTPGVYKKTFSKKGKFVFYVKAKDFAGNVQNSTQVTVLVK